MLEISHALENDIIDMLFTKIASY